MGEVKDASLEVEADNDQEVAEGMASTSLAELVGTEDVRLAMVRSTLGLHTAYVADTHVEVGDTVAAKVVVVADKEDSLGRAAEVGELENLSLELTLMTSSGLGTAL